VSWTLNGAIEYFSLSERSFGVATTITDRVDRVTDTKQSDSLIIDFDTDAAAIRQFQQWCDLDFHHTLPSA
jgi:hypothetical protein